MLAWNACGITHHLVNGRRQPKQASEPWAADGQLPGQSQGEALRCHCRVAVLMQRACDAMHAQNAAHMPLDTQLQLLSVLQVGRLPASICCVPLGASALVAHCWRINDIEDVPNEMHLS